MLRFEGVLGQLRHAYALMVSHEGDWAPRQRKHFAEGLVGPQIEALEQIYLDYARQQAELNAAELTNAKLRRRFKEAEQELLASVPHLISASQGRRLIFSVFHMRGDRDGE